MTEPILHHFDWSPYAEKVRVLFGLKQLAWRSVQVPMVMPKPDLTALTGGYRKTPVLQIGADIYCDTSCIARELERRYPQPTLFAGSGRGLALALATWADRFFEPGAGLSMAGNEALPKELLEDRREFFTHMDFDRFVERRPHMLGQVVAHLRLLEEQFEDGRAFLGGEQAGLVDATAYYVVWMLRTFVAASDKILARHSQLLAWEARVQAIGHGRRRDIEASESLAEARASRPGPGEGVAADDPSGLHVGQHVTVTPDDYGKVPVDGELATLDSIHVAIRRRDARAGEVVVHFPRLGYVVAAA